MLMKILPWNQVFTCKYLCFSFSNSLATEYYNHSTAALVKGSGLGPKPQSLIRPTHFLLQSAVNNWYYHWKVQELCYKLYYLSMEKCHSTFTLNADLYVIRSSINISMCSKLRVHVTVVGQTHTYSHLLPKERSQALVLHYTGHKRCEVQDVWKEQMA